MRSAPWFQLLMTPFRSLAMIPSSDDSTMAARRARASAEPDGAGGGGTSATGFSAIPHLSEGERECEHHGIRHDELRVNVGHGPALGKVASGRRTRVFLLRPRVRPSARVGHVEEAVRER